jgi:hypothetical protein
MHVNDIPVLPNYQSVLKKFEDKFTRRGQRSCWPWHATRTAKGYGRVNIQRTYFLAHRVAYVLYKGPIPDGVGFHGTCLLHRCDNPECVNPNHMFFGTVEENNNDMARKNRSAYGVRANTAKLDDEKVRAIRTSSATVASIARMYGVGWSCVHKIRERETWRRVE